jgi:hypothetical protein
MNYIEGQFVNRYIRMRAKARALGFDPDKGFETGEDYDRAFWERGGRDSLINRLIADPVDMHIELGLEKEFNEYRASLLPNSSFHRSYNSFTRVLAAKRMRI